MLPIGQDYRDLQKFIPGVQYTEDTVRGPSAGGSGQDNVYLFDGANVSLPLFGNLSAEPAIPRHRPGHGRHRRRQGRGLRPIRRFLDRLGQQVGHQRLPRRGRLPVPDRGYVRGLEQRHPVPVRAGPKLVEREPRRPDSHGPPLLLRFVLPARSRTRDNRANLYGDLPPYNSTRNEGFGKLTITPSQALLVQPELPRLQARGQERPLRRQRLGDDGHRATRAT